LFLYYQYCALSITVACRAEYYETASSLQYIPHMRTPTLFLQALDDPFLGVSATQERVLRGSDTALLKTD
jgi:predicted alpha/beta-fold hydrolase